MHIADMAFVAIQEALVVMLRGEKEAYRKMSGDVIAWLNHGPANPAADHLPSLLESDNVCLREGAICMIGFLRAHAFLLRLEAIASDGEENQQTRTFAVWSIGRLRQKSSAPLLADIASDIKACPQLANCCRLALGHIRKAAGDTVCYRPAHG